MQTFVSQVGFRKGGIQLCGGLGRRTQLEIVLAALLMASLLSLFACAITLGIHYKNGETTTLHRYAGNHMLRCCGDFYGVGDIYSDRSVV